MPLAAMNIVFNESAIPLNIFGLDGAGGVAATRLRHGGAGPAGGGGMKVTVEAPANIAFIKYWGARDLDEAIQTVLLVSDLARDDDVVGNATRYVHAVRSPDVERVIVAADNPGASLPSKACNASVKSPVLTPLR